MEQIEHGDMVVHYEVRYTEGFRVRGRKEEQNVVYKARSLDDARAYLARLPQKAVNDPVYGPITITGGTIIETTTRVMD